MYLDSFVLSAQHHIVSVLTICTCLLVSAVCFGFGRAAFAYTRHLPLQDSDPDKFDRAKLVEILTAPYIEDSGDGIVALDPHALKKLFTTTSSLLQASLGLCFLVLLYVESGRQTGRQMKQTLCSAHVTVSLPSVGWFGTVMIDSTSIIRQLAQTRVWFLVSRSIWCGRARVGNAGHVRYHGIPFAPRLKEAPRLLHSI